MTEHASPYTYSECAPEIDAVGFVVVGFSVHGTSIVPSEITYVQDCSTAMEFYNEDAEQVALAAAYAIPKTSDFPTRDRLRLIAANGKMPEGWQNPFMSILSNSKPANWKI